MIKIIMIVIMTMMFMLKMLTLLMMTMIMLTMRMMAMIMMNISAGRLWWSSHEVCGWRSDIPAWGHQFYRPQEQAPVSSNSLLSCMHNQLQTRLEILL